MQTTNNTKNSVVSKVTWQISIQWGGVFRTSPEYSTEEECVKALVPFMKQFNGKFLRPTLVRNVHYYSKEQA